MADRADSRGLVEQLLLAGVGGLVLTAERIEGLVEAIAARTGLELGEARQLVEDQIARWRADATRVGDRMTHIRRELGVANRDEVDDLRLQLAQLEHRLKLLEKD